MSVEDSNRFEYEGNAYIKEGGSFYRLIGANFNNPVLEVLTRDQYQFHFFMYQLLTKQIKDEDEKDTLIFKYFGIRDPLRPPSFYDNLLM